MPVVPGQMRTFRGHHIQVQDPDPLHIDILDIARALSHEVRYGGHLNRRYCVAEHSCHIHDLVPEELKLQALLHDATEAYLKDIPKPIKVLCPDYGALEDRLWVHIARRFDLPVKIDPLIKKLDVVIRDAESVVVHGTEYDLDPIVAGVKIQCWEWQRAESEFMHRFHCRLGDRWVNYMTKEGL
jgi:hypothetical protein